MAVESGINNQASNIQKALKLGGADTRLMSMICYLFVTNEDVARLVETCKDMDKLEIRDYIDAVRAKRLKTDGFKNSEDFVDSHKNNVKDALEKLCQHKIHPRRIVELSNVEPDKIYKIHSLTEFGLYSEVVKAALQRKAG